MLISTTVHMKRVTHYFPHTHTHTQTHTDTHRHTHARMHTHTHTHTHTHNTIGIIPLSPFSIPRGERLKKELDL